MKSKAKEAREPAPAPTGRMLALLAARGDWPELDAVECRRAAYIVIAMFAAGAALIPIIALPIHNDVDVAAVLALAIIAMKLKYG